MNPLRYFPVAALTVVMGAGGFCVQGAEPSPGALVCSEARYKFGSVTPDAVIQHSFVLTNRGDRVVKITGVHATCGCTEAVVTTNEVAPGRTTDLVVKLTFKGRRGHLLKSVYVDTDDPANMALRLEVEGVVTVPIDAQPEGIHFGTVGVEGKVEREVLLTATGTNEFHIVSVTASSPQLLATCEVLEAGRRYRVRISSDGPRSPGSSMASVRVVTDSPRMETVDIPVAFFVAGDIVASPAVLLAIPTLSNEVRSARFTLWSPSSKSFKVTKVECPVDAMAATVNASVAGRVQVEVKTRGSLEEADGKSVRILTDLPSLKELLIPVRVLSADGGKSAAARP